MWSRVCVYNLICGCSENFESILLNCVLVLNILYGDTECLISINVVPGGCWCIKGIVGIYISFPLHINSVHKNENKYVSLYHNLDINTQL